MSYDRIRDVKMIKKGKFILISSGAYSDYGVIIIARTLIDIDIPALEKEYKKLNLKSMYRFVNWLIFEKNVIEEVDYIEIHLGDYDEFKPTIDDDPGYRYLIYPDRD